MPTITITDEELHEIVEVLNYRVMAYRRVPPLHGKKELSPDAVAWIDRYEARTNVTIQKLEGILNDPVNPCDPYHLKQIASWNKCLDEHLNKIKILKQFVTELAEDDCSYGDNCPTFGTRHGQCLRCRAVETLSNLTTPET